MRKGVGKVPGADPELWGILFEDLPEELTGRGNTPLPVVCNNQTLA